MLRPAFPISVPWLGVLPGEDSDATVVHSAHDITAKCAILHGCVDMCFERDHVVHATHQSTTGAKCSMLWP